MNKNIIYDIIRPFGCPIRILRGSGCKDIRDYLKNKGFNWDRIYFCYVNYLDRQEFLAILLELKQKGYNVIPKKNINQIYIYKELE